MSYGISQLSPHASTHGTRLKIVARGADTTVRQSFQRIQLLQQVEPGFFESDFVEPDWAAEVGVEERTRWSVLLGAVIVVGISGGFWTGVGLIVARLLR